MDSQPPPIPPVPPADPRMDDYQHSPPPVRHWDAGWAIQAAWHTVKTQPIVVVAHLVGNLLGNAISLFSSIVIGVIEFSATMESGGRLATEAQVTFLFMRLGAMLVNLPFALYFGAGVDWYTLKLVRYGNAQFSDLFKPRRVGAHMGATLLFSLAIFFGTVLCIVPGIILALGFLLYRFLILDGNVPATESLAASWNLTRGHKGRILVLSILLIALQFLGFCACGVGVIVTSPMVAIAFAHVYGLLVGPPADVAAAFD